MTPEQNLQLMKTLESKGLMADHIDVVGVKASYDITVRECSST